MPGLVQGKEGIEDSGRSYQATFARLHHFYVTDAFSRQVPQVPPFRRLAGREAFFMKRRMKISLRKSNGSPRARMGPAA